MNALARRGRATPVPGALLSPLAIRVESGVIRVGDVEMGADAARALWVRLGEAIDASRDADELRGWQDVEMWLDAHFAHAVPAHGVDVATLASVGGLIRRDRDDLALMRVGTYTFAMLRPRRRAARVWEGPCIEHAPGVIAPVARTTRRRVRVDGATVEAAPWIDPELGRVVRPTRRIAPSTS